MRVKHAVLLSGVPMSLFAAGAVAADDTHAGRVVANAVQASRSASASAAHSVLASGQVVSAASAVPLAIGGAVLSGVAAVSTATARGSVRAATVAPIGIPLPISDETVTVIPPNEALKGHVPRAGRLIEP